MKARAGHAGNVRGNAGGNVGGRARVVAEDRPRGPEREAGELLYGLRAGLAVFELRRDDILRVGFGRAVRSEVAELAQWAASRQVPCGEVSDVELDRLAQSTHHEGLILSTRPRRWTTPKELAEVLVGGRGAAVAFDRVRNPHNIGAILRSAAFFGFDAALLGAPAPHPGLAPAAVRVAEGGVEHLRLARTTDLADTLGRLRAAGCRWWARTGTRRRTRAGSRSRGRRCWCWGTSGRGSAIGCARSAMRSWRSAGRARSSRSTWPWRRGC